MHIDPAGHVVITPREVQREIVARRAHFINNLWLFGTPAAFPSYDAYCELLDFLAERLHVHPRNLVIRGSSKIGFSIAPKPEKVWVRMRPDSDLDLAIVDPDYFHYLDREIRGYERSAAGKIFRGSERWKTVGRQQSRRFYTYQYSHLPAISCVQEHRAILEEAPVAQCCGTPRVLTAFIYRDWWSLVSRCDFDVRELCGKCSDPAFPQGGDVPRTSILMRPKQETADGFDAGEDKIETQS